MNSLVNIFHKLMSTVSLVDIFSVMFEDDWVKS